jgi:hypothetical protein
VSAPLDVLAVMERHAAAELASYNEAAKAGEDRAHELHVVMAEAFAARAAVAELIAADAEYDEAREELDAAKRRLGNWNVNPLPYNDPAQLRMVAATRRRRAALAACRGTP